MNFPSQHKGYIYDLVQDSCNSIVLAMELP